MNMVKKEGVKDEMKEILCTPQAVLIESKLLPTICEQKLHKTNSKWEY